MHTIAEVERSVPVRPKRASEKGHNFAQSFAQIVAILMRDRALRTLPVGELEWLLLPPLIAGQFAIAHSPVPRGADKPKSDPEANKSKPLVPVAFALWASVSDETDKVLCKALETQPRLKPSDWTSGNNVWIIAVGGEPRALPKFLDELASRQFKGKRVKVRMRGSDNKFAIRQL